MSLLVFMLPACNGETLPGPVLADNALQIRSVELPELSGTRALGATQLNEIGVYVTDNDHTALADAPYVYKLQNGTWSCDTPPSITVEESASDYLYAYSPSGLAVTNVLSGSHTVPVTVVADNFTASGQTDYLYGKSDPLTVNKNSRAVTVHHVPCFGKGQFPGAEVEQCGRNGDVEKDRTAEQYSPFANGYQWCHESEGRHSEWSGVYQLHYPEW